MASGVLKVCYGCFLERSPQKVSQGSLSKGGPGSIPGLVLLCCIVYKSAMQSTTGPFPQPEKHPSFQFTARKDTHSKELVETRKNPPTEFSLCSESEKFSPISYPITPVSMELGNENECSE